GLGIHRGDGARDHRGDVAQTYRIQCRGTHAMVRGETHHHDRGDAQTLEVHVQVRLGRLAGAGVVLAEPRVAVLGAHALAHLEGAFDDVQVRVVLGSRCALHAVHGPCAAVLREVRGRGGVPVAGVDHWRAGLDRPPDLTIRRGHD